MKKLFLLCGIFAAAIAGASARTVVADFESGGFPEGFGYWTGYTYDVQPTVVDNPYVTGINTSAKVMHVKTKATDAADWWSNRIVLNFGRDITIDDSNRYLHIKHYRTNALRGYRIGGIADDWGNSIFQSETCEANKWFDIVVDLKANNITSLKIFHVLLDLSWGDDRKDPGTDFYFDDIELNDNPMAALDPGVNNGALTVATFEEGSTIPNYKWQGSPNTTLEIVDNPDKSGVNTTSKVMKIDQTNEDTWWTRFRITLDSPLLISNDNKYFHYMIKSPMSEADFVCNFSGSDKWLKSNFTRNTWTDAVVDLSDYVGTAVSVFDICPNMTANATRICYIDELEFNNNPNQRRNTIFDGIITELTICDDDWTFIDTKPTVDVFVKNTTDIEKSFNIVCEFHTDKRDNLTTLTEPVTLAAGQDVTKKITFSEAVPNFYRLYVKLSNGEVNDTKTHKVISYRPTEIESPQDAQADFDAFWEAAKAELATVEPNYKVTERSNNGSHTVYDVEMTSIGGYRLSGYLSVPNKDGKFPTIVTSCGYNTSAGVPDRNDEFVQFIYNVRGQGISNTPPFAQDWLISASDPNNKEAFTKDNYYYRGAYMDALRAVDFVCAKAEDYKVDTRLLFAEGESQGGALTLVIGAFDKRVKGIVPRLPFMSDFDDYYTIKMNDIEMGTWPMNVFDNYCTANGVSHDNLFDMLSYFDVKNMAHLINVPTLMASSLQDGTCPPHINFAAFNCIASNDKEYFICKECDHYVNDAFIEYRNAWYAKLINDINAGIDNVIVDDDNDDNDNTIYNLAGQVVTNPTPGFYIQNGKKLLIR